MPDFDPYAVLGVARSATREEIARAYRALAKQLHPDAGSDAHTPAGTAMARVNEAWRILSDPARRAAWHRQHAIALAPAQWAPVPAGDGMRHVPRRPAPAPTARRRDSGWITLAILAAIAVLVGVVMVAVNVAAGPVPVDDGEQFASAELTFTHPKTWTVAPGVAGQPSQHQVIAQVVTFDVGASELCTDIAQPCQWTPESVPPGEASIIITAWRDGHPPVPNPTHHNSSSPDTDVTIGGQPAAFTWEQHDDGAVAWWQLSPPGFPDRWIEVHATIGGRALEQEVVLGQIVRLLRSVEFVTS